MNILITNDDGIEAQGIHALAKKFKEMGNVVVVAPNKQMSATSHSITTVNPIRVQKYHKDDVFFGYAITGTPADCVKLALTTLLDEKPDLVLSGINHGRNTGINIMYSGTVAGAAEGFLIGIPSFAISLSSHDVELECDTAAEYAFKIVSEIMKQEDKKNIFININIPAVEKEKIQGIKTAKSSNSYWEDEYEKRIDPFGRPYFWFNGSYIYDANEEDIDDAVLDAGYIAVTPLQYQFTNLEQLEIIKVLVENIKNIEDEEENLEENLENGENIEDLESEENLENKENIENLENEENKEISAEELVEEVPDEDPIFKLVDAEIEKILSEDE